MATKQDQTHWIWCGDSPRSRNTWAWARKSFFCNRPDSATLRITADLRYTAWINGQEIGFGPPRYHAATPTVDEYEVSSFLRNGVNFICVQVYSPGHVLISSCTPQRGALWAEILAEGTLVRTGTDWKMRSDPGYSTGDLLQRGSTQPAPECYDARIALKAPWLADYEDSDWPFARHAEPLSQSYAPEPRDIPVIPRQAYPPERLIDFGLAHLSRPILSIPFSELAEEWSTCTRDPDRPGKIHLRTGLLNHSCLSVDASALRPQSACYLLWDFGRIWSGYPAIEASGTPGTVIDLTYAEHLTSGKVNPYKARLSYFDRIILGEDRIRHRITWPKSARYLQVYIHQGRAEIHRIEWERSTYPITRRGSFYSDHPVFDQAVEISLHTTQLCMEDSYMDTPWRERGSWLGDDLTKAEISNDYFQDYALARRFLLHHARGQRGNGMLQGKYPGNITSDVSTWTLRYAPSLLEYCTESGDWEFGEKQLPVLKNILAWMHSLRTDCGLYQAPPVKVDEVDNQYNFIDWAPIDMRGINSAWNAFAHCSLDSIRKIALRCGEESLAAEIQEIQETHRQAFQQRLWDRSRGVFVNGLLDGKLIQRWGCHENYLALLYDLTTPEQTDSILYNLQREDLMSTFEVNPDDYDILVPQAGKIPTISLARSQYRWSDDKMVPIGTPYFAYYMILALCKYGMANHALQFIEKHWGEFSRQGGTTVWETWNQQQSLSHGWSSTPAIFASRIILGVQSAGHSEDHYTVLPWTHFSDSFGGKVSTRKGVIQIDWQRPHLKVDLPEGFEFTVGLPSSGQASLLCGGIPHANTSIRIHNHSRYQCIRLNAGTHRLTLRQ